MDGPLLLCVRDEELEALLGVDSARARQVILENLDRWVGTAGGPQARGVGLRV